MEVDQLESDDAKSHSNSEPRRDKLAEEQWSL